MLAAHDFVWVSHALDDEVSQLTLDGAVVQRYQVGRSPREMAADDTAVWVANEGDNTLSRLEPATGQVGPTLALPERPLALAYADGFLWVALASDEVVKVDPDGGEITTRLATGRKPAALLFAGGRLWVANEGSNTVVAIDVARERLGRPIAVGSAPAALAWSPCGEGCGDLWVANEADSTVSRVRWP
jgi:serine/threonine-protein kinase